MGGVDKLDFLITLYRTFIRSKKWTLRMFTHAIDIACANAWLEYKEKANTLGIPEKDTFDLLGFRAYIAEGLIKANKMPAKKKGRPTAQSLSVSSINGSSPVPSPSMGTPPSSRSSSEVRSISEVRLDQIGHFPSFDCKSFASRCKNPKCNGQSRVKCLKCNVHLCLNKNNNCFLSYHVNK